MIKENTRLLGQRQRTLLYTASGVARISTSDATSTIQSQQGHICYRRGILGTQILYSRQLSMCSLNQNDAAFVPQICKQTNSLSKRKAQTQSSQAPHYTNTLVKLTRIITVSVSAHNTSTNVKGLCERPMPPNDIQPSSYAIFLLS